MSMFKTFEISKTKNIDGDCKPLSMRLMVLSLTLIFSGLPRSLTFARNDV